MASKRILWWIAAGGVSLLASGQSGPREAPVPSDPLELVTGKIKIADKPAPRKAAIELLNRARNSYAVRTAGRAYELKVTFKVDSGGQTDHDGAWEMDDVFDPKQGHRWTAKSWDAYTTARISSNDMFYGEDSGNYVPLRLHEARAALFDPIPSPGYVDRARIRISKAFYNGAKVTCVLLSRPGNGATDASGRLWEETEDCIDPQSGLVQVHSQVPGRYYAYDYTNAPELAGRTLPHKVIVTEAGKTVTEITVQGLKELPAVDSSLFLPTDEMKARGKSIALTGAQKISRFVGGDPSAPGAAVHPVVVFGLVTPAGELVEAHSLQPSDPNSQAAVEAAKQMTFPESSPLVARPRQHFVFIIEKFVSSQ